MSTFSRSQTAGASLLTTETLTGNTGLTQNMKWGGGSYAFAFNNNRQAQSDAFATRNPVLNTNFNAAFVQPLMRGFRIDGTRAALQITQLNQKVSEVALRATFVVDPHNVVQHVTVNGLNVGRAPAETLRVLDGLQSDELCACNRPVGGETLKPAA